MNKQQPRDWWRILQWPLFLASAGVAAWVSYTQQRQLGIYVGWDSPWGLPIILDGLAAATLLSYIRKPAAFNRVVSTLVIATAVVGNAQAAIYDADTADLPAPLWAVIAWKVLPPMAVFTIAHYIAHERKETGTWAPNSQSDLQSSVPDVGGTRGLTDTSARSSAAPLPATAPISSPTGSASATTATPTSASTTTRRSSVPKKPRRSGSPSRKHRTPSEPLSVLLQRVEAEQLQDASQTQLVNRLGIGWPKAKELWLTLHPETSSPAPLSPNGTSPATTSH